MIWNCFYCEHKYYAESENSALINQCPKCHKYQSTNQSIVQDYQEERFKVGGGTPIFVGIWRGIFVFIALIGLRIGINYLIDIGDMSRRYGYFAIGISAISCIMAWNDEAEKRDSTAGHLIAFVSYALIGFWIGKAHGILWGIFWAFWVFWDGLKLLVHTLQGL
ncbi:hypothetical protein [Hymenobacter actinosclerus]|uniref:hypothetical protein n=1 Tax=Hymenobacter actinosclerus TaxID=82805 RepID=UPI0011608CA4|nr:hypothetical protein [Hymenobacter actinosclerus]